MNFLHKFLFLFIALFLLTGDVYAGQQKNKIAILPFKLQGENFQTVDMGKIVSEWLITAFVKDGRFEVIERKLLSDILEEQQLVEAGLVSNETASEVGKLLGVKVIISGSVMKLGKVIEVNARIIDVSSASIITAENVRSRNIEKLQEEVILMAQKIIRDFPLKGYAASRHNDIVVIDLGKRAGVKLDMKFDVYKEGEQVKHPITNEVLFVEEIKTGAIKIIEVREYISKGKIISETSENIQVGNLVKSIREGQVDQIAAQPAKESATKLTPTSKKTHVAVTQEVVVEKPKKVLPTTEDISITTDEDKIVSGKLKANNPEKDPLTFSIVTNGSLGTAKITNPATGTFTYTPNTDVSGSDSFTFRVNNGVEDSNISSVTVAIASVNDVPKAKGLSLAVNEDVPTTGQLSATDVDGDLLTFSVVANGKKGKVVVTNPSRGTYSYTPNKDATGEDSFTFKASDGSLDSKIATVKVTISEANDPPIASDSSLSVKEDIATDGQLSATDPDNDSLEYMIVANGTKGSAVITDAVTGTYTYNPNPGAIGSDTFIFKVSDGDLNSNFASVAVTIASVNDAPTTSESSITTNENTPASGLLSATDPDGDPLTFSIVKAGSKGTVTITNPSNGAFTYTPNPDETGDDSFTFRVNDGQVDSNTSAVTVSITPVQQPHAETAISDSSQTASQPDKRIERDQLSDETFGPQIIEIATGEFQMGGNIFSEKPKHLVNISHPLSFMTSEVTFEEYDQFCEATGRAKPDDEGWGRQDRPVINVSWEDAQQYAKWLSEQTGYHYRLPLENEWEWAARSGETTSYTWGSHFKKNMANCKKCGTKFDNLMTAPVRTFPPNNFGLHDMLGNTWEWVQDCWQDNYYNAPDKQTERQFIGSCDNRTIRGGAWNSPKSQLTVSSRLGVWKDTTSNFIGFRLVRDTGEAFAPETASPKKTKQPTQKDAEEAVNIEEFEDKPVLKKEDYWKKEKDNWAW